MSDHARCPPLIYIAGPFTADTPWEIAENVRRAERWGLEVAWAGGMPVIPHANTHLFHGQCTPDFWYRGTLALLEVCDGALFFKGWPLSKGAIIEHGRALALGMPILDEDYPAGSKLIALVQDAFIFATRKAQRQETDT